MADETYDPKKFVPADEEFDPNRFVVVGEPQTAPMAAQRGAPASEQARARAKEFAISALPAIGAAAASLATGPAAPLTATMLSAALGGFAGKGVEMGLRTGTGIGAETVPPTTGGRLVAGAKEGLSQAMFEGVAGVAARAAGAAARATVYHAERSALGKAMRREQKILGQQAQAKTEFERALSANDVEISNIEKSMEAVSREMDVAKGNAKISAQQKYDALLAKKQYLQRQATEEAFRIEKIESAAESADRALAATGAGVPEMGQMAVAHQQAAGSLVHRLERDTIETMGAGYVGLEEEAAKRAPKAAGTKPLFERTVQTIRRIPRIKEGPGQNWTEINEILAKVENDYANALHSTPERVVGQETDPLTLGQRPRKVAGTPAKGMEASIPELLVMQGNLSQDIAKLESKGPSGERTARVLRGLRDDTDAFIKAQMKAQGWEEGPAALDAVRAQWATKSSYMEHQVFQTLKKDPARAHELLTVESGYTPVVKKVLKDAGGYELLWPDIRRKWLEANFVRNGRLDFSAFVQGAKDNAPIIAEIFDTPQAMAQFRRLHTSAMKLEALKGKSLKSIADNAKYARLQGDIQKIGEEMAAVDDVVAKEVEDIFASGQDKTRALQGKLAEARGYKRERLREVYADRQKALEAQLQELGMSKPGASRDIFGPIPRILMYRGTAGMLGGLAAGLAGGGTGAMAGAGVGLAGGYALHKADQAIVKRLLYLADDPVAMQKVMGAISDFERGVAKAGPALRAALLGAQAAPVVRDIALAPSH